MSHDYWTSQIFEYLLTHWKRRINNQCYQRTNTLWSWIRKKKKKMWARRRSGAVGRCATLNRDSHARACSPVVRTRDVEYTKHARTASLGAGFDTNVAKGLFWFFRSPYHGPYRLLVDTMIKLSRRLYAVHGVDRHVFIRRIPITSRVIYLWYLRVFW